MNKYLKIFLLFIPLSVISFYIFSFGFGCELGMGHGFDCRVLLPTSFYLSIGSFLFFILTSIYYFVERPKMRKVFLIIFVSLISLVTLILIFGANYNSIPQ